MLKILRYKSFNVELLDFLPSLSLSGYMPKRVTILDFTSLLIFTSQFPTSGNAAGVVLMVIYMYGVLLSSHVAIITKFVKSIAALLVHCFC